MADCKFYQVVGPSDNSELTQNEYSCLEDCPGNAPFMVPQTLFDGYTGASLCVNACPNTMPYVQSGSLTCAEKCDFYEYQNHKVGSITIPIQRCVGQCKFGVREGDIVKCELQCPSNLPYFNESD